MIIKLIAAIVVIGVWLLCIYLILRSWRNRGNRQIAELGDFPTAPEVLGEVRRQLTGLYVGSTVAPSWQNRVAVGDKGDRAAAVLVEYPEGVLMLRQGASDIWMPDDAIVSITRQRGVAGKVMTADGVLVVEWELPSGRVLYSGLRGDDKAAYPEWIRNENLVDEPDPAPRDEPAAAASPTQPADTAQAKDTAQAENDAQTANDEQGEQR